jgi:UDPglucose 6-dehydrogenase
MIGIIGYGTVGKTVYDAFNKAERVVYDPLKFPDNKFDDVKKSEVIFVCVPTPTDDNEYKDLTETLDQLKDYRGIVVVKSTILPKYLEGYNVVYNPEFLSRTTHYSDFVRPEYIVLGGNIDKCKYVYKMYRKYSEVKVDEDRVFYTDIETASLVKYMMNTFFATKVTFMNQMFDVSEEMGANWKQATNILKNHPWMGTGHYQVPGHEGRGFAGPCLPKDTSAISLEYDIPLLEKVLELNASYRSTKEK